MNYDQGLFFEQQPVLAKLFLTARQEGRLSHAYLLYGEPSSPLLECAMYLAESIECRKSLLACGKCDSCLRFEKGTHPDFMLLDGSAGLIRKSDIDGLADFFSMSALEKGHQSVYIINRIENITSEAVNALLKFLEEPSGRILALLTTANREKTLPTIISRCQLVQIKKPDLSEFAEGGTDDEAKQLYIAANLTSDEEEREKLIGSKEFGQAYDAAVGFLSSLASFPQEAAYVLLTQAGDNLRGNKCYNYFYSILSIVFGDAVSAARRTPFDDVTGKLRTGKESLVRAIRLLDEAKSKAQANMNFTFVLARLALIMEE